MDAPTLPDPTARILDQVTADQWKALAQKRIYFAHQSVGLDMLNGIADIAAEFPGIQIHVLRRPEVGDQTGGCLSHSWIGENYDPLGKIEAFERDLGSPAGDVLDAAALKLCFLDITAKTNAAELLDQYAAALDRIREGHPDLLIVHFTAPLTTTNMTLRRMVKRLVKGQDPRRDNLARGEYSAALLARYGGQEPVFDLGRLQSTYPDGSRRTYEERGRTGHALVPQYSRDGYHLNRLGRRIIAAHFLVFLAQLWDEPSDESRGTDP